MIDIERAIETLKDMKGVFDTRGHKQYSLPALGLAISTLEKQTPKKPQEVDVDLSTFVCPNCLSTIMYTDEKETHNHCLSCGQRLDLEEEE